MRVILYAGAGMRLAEVDMPDGCVSDGEMIMARIDDSHRREWEAEQDALRRLVDDIVPCE